MTEPRCTGTKQCSRCQTVKHVLCFAAHSEHSDGLQSACRECLNEFDRIRYHESKATSGALVPSILTGYNT